MNFEFATAGRILFGQGRVREAGEHAAAIGQRALVLTGTHPERAAPLIESLEAQGVAFELFTVDGEPTIEMANAGAEAARLMRAELVIGMGGGSVLDATKAIAALTTNDGNPLRYLEVIGQGLPFEQAPLPCMAIPTTSGTGAEVTRNAVLASKEHRVKVSLRSPLMLPRVAIVDPELTYSVPPEVTAYTGMDALTQVIEPYVCNAPSPVADGIAREGMSRIARSLRRAYDDGRDQEAREDMAIGSLLGGLALANARLGGVHGFAGPLGGMYDAPHGALIAALLPQVMEVNIRALRERQPHGETLRRYDDVARLLTGDPNATAADGVAWVRALSQDLNIAPLAAYGIIPDHYPQIVEKAARANSMKGNSILLTDGELLAIVSAS